MARRIKSEDKQLNFKDIRKKDSLTMKLMYEGSHYRDAVQALAGTSGKQRDRLRHAFHCIWTLTPDSFSGFTELKRQHQEIMKAGSAIEAQFEGEGQIDATMRLLHWRRIAAISSMIVDLAFAICDAQSGRSG